MEVIHNSDGVFAKAKILEEDVTERYGVGHIREITHAKRGDLEVVFTGANLAHHYPVGLFRELFSPAPDCPEAAEFFAEPTTEEDI